MPGEAAARDAAVREYLAMTGCAVPAVRRLVRDQPRCGLARAVAALVQSGDWDDGRLRAEMVTAHRDAHGSGARDRSLIHAVHLYTHRQYRAAADHLVVHFAQFPADEIAGSMLGAFALAGPVEYREYGEQLTEQQYALAGPESWAWASWLAAARAEQGRTDEAWNLAQHALRLNPRSGPAAHARAHAEHDQGAGPAATVFIDSWLQGDPRALQRPHLQWHAALQAIASGDFADARRRADSELRDGDVGMRAATNWRLLLAGQVPARGTEREQVLRLLAEPGGWAEVFHTFQLALALAVTADSDALTALARRAAADPRHDYAGVLAPVAEALAHLTAGLPGNAVDLLTALGHRTERLGGVRVEREIVHDTLARALVDAGCPDRAAHLLHHRTTTRRHHTYEDLLLIPRPRSAPMSPADAPTT
ncbi:hypothetical protein ACH4UT_04770 [Streptomyces sp. NPDC020799]|uniref:hypothetical protein n=1 Tax=unclassified Streptomyces TaxID=2593676 RepID=UPI0033E47A36